jgi:hypothetical protein
VPIYTLLSWTKFPLPGISPNQDPNSNLKHPSSLASAFSNVQTTTEEWGHRKEYFFFVFFHQFILYRRLQLEEKEEQQSEDKVKVRSHDPPLLDLVLVLVRRYFDPATTDPIGGNKDASSILIEPQIWATYHLKWTTLARMRTLLSFRMLNQVQNTNFPWCCMCYHFGAPNNSNGRSLTQGLLSSCSNIMFAHFIFQRRWWA